jgi:hypothetical protein
VDDGFLCDKGAVVVVVTMKYILCIKKHFDISTYKALTEIYETRNEISLD